MVQVVIRRPLTAEARVRALVNPCGICGEQSGTGTGFSTVNVYNIPPLLSKRIIWGMRHMLTEVGICAWVLDPPHLQGGGKTLKRN
jgi:hypothetical protein